MDIDIDEEMPLELMENVKLTSMDMLPQKSKDIYNKIYKVFKDWQNGYGVKKITSNLILAYLHELDKKNIKPTSLWAYHSILKATLRAYEDVDIAEFYEVKAYLKKKSSGYKSTKAEVFIEEEIRKFITEAADGQWLDVKVVCIFGIYGACRTDEFVQITMKDIEKHGDLFLVRLLQTKTKIVRSFTITGAFSGIVQQYIDLRPPNLIGRFFLNYQRGKCTSQFIGKNKFSKMPRRIAEYLRLDTPARYTGHAFRRTSTTILANSGADMETIMRHGGWRNESCAKGYIEDSLHYKQRIGNMIPSSIFVQTPSTVNCADLPTINGQTSLSVSGTSLSAVNGGSSSSIIKQKPASVDDFFESDIDEVKLIQLVDRASQNNVEQPSEYRVITEDQIRTHETISADIGGERSKRDGMDTVLTQCINNSSMLNAIMPDSFKSVNFEKIKGCTFNFYLTK